MARVRQADVLTHDVETHWLLLRANGRASQHSCDAGLPVRVGVGAEESDCLNLEQTARQKRHTQDLKRLEVPVETVS